MDCSWWLRGIFSHALSMCNRGFFRKISREDMVQEFLLEEIFLEGNSIIVLSMCKCRGHLIIHPCLVWPHALPWVMPASVFTALEIISSSLDMLLPHPGFFSLTPLLKSICFAQISHLNHFWSDSFNVNPRMEGDLVKIPRLDKKKEWAICKMGTFPLKALFHSDSSFLFWTGSITSRNNQIGQVQFPGSTVLLFFTVVVA